MRDRNLLDGESTLARLQENLRIHKSAIRSYFQAVKHLSLEQLEGTVHICHFQAESTI